MDKIRRANSVDPDQTAPSGAVCSGSILFAIQPNLIKRQTALSRLEGNKSQFQTIIG